MYSFNKVREVEGAGPEPWPGWMCGRGQPPVRITPPPRDGRAPRVNLYGASPQTGETIGERPVELEGGAAHGEHWETPHEAMPSARLPPMKSALPKSHRSNPDRCMAPPIARPGMTPGYPESSSYSRRSSVSTPANPVQHRISVLESRLRHLTDLLHTERIDHVRSNLDFNTYFLKMIEFTTQSPPFSGELRALQNTLNKGRADLNRKYEAFLAPDALSNLAVRELQPENRQHAIPPGAAAGRSFSQSLPQALPRPRFIHPAAFNPRLTASSDPLPRTSPTSRYFADALHSSPRSPRISASSEPLSRISSTSRLFPDEPHHAPRSPLPQSAVIDSSGPQYSMPPLPPRQLSPGQVPGMSDRDETMEGVKSS